MSYTARTIIAWGDLPTLSMPHFPLKVQLPKKVSEGERAQRRKTGVSSLLTEAEKRTFKQAGLRPRQKKRGSFKSGSTLQEIGGKEDSSSEPLRLPLLGVRLHPCPAGRSQRDACVKSPDDVRLSVDELVQQTGRPSTTPSEKK